MTETIVLGVAAVFGVLSVLGAAAGWAAHSERFRRYRIRAPKAADPLPAARKYRGIVLNSVLSVGCYVLFVRFGSPWLLAGESSGFLAFAGQVLATLLLYDFLYYLLHRALHHPTLMRLVHAVHHQVRFPTAMDGLFVHPAELVAGIGLLMVSTSIVGPVSEVSFLAIVLVHGVVNTVTHTNLVLPHPVFKLTNYWAIRHDFHHGHHLNRNFAVIFPVWDRMFGTYK